MVLGGLRSSGAFAAVKASRWRSNRLLVLCYHGVSLADEHLWDPNLFISQARFAHRMELLKRQGCQVLSLEEGLRRLTAGNLPPASVAITFDDGLYCYYKAALPILESLSFPATVYLTTFYSDLQEPVFDIACAYILWSCRAATVNLKPVTSSEETYSLDREESRSAAVKSILQFSRTEHLSASAKSQLLERLSSQLGYDLDSLRKRRLLGLMTPDEAAECSRRGTAIELHTHRHRTPLNREKFIREIEDNRARIEAITGVRPTHFCYPSGVYHKDFLPWLSECGVVSATTCDPGIVSQETHALLIPRIIDATSLSDLELEGWLSGVSAALPKRRVAH